ncbi:hypothetical protein NEPAR06_1179 [Nematocida parisii]|uniref:Nudix hydrolase domain-containing protein n=1 Tax=Nematocida parisii (strain ERTm3) TaxID=935791 RepID=I3EKP7_NEMP3|nr:uncharacterized protein NEPG_00668 [Nematocida parisii ERTm1]EIJ89794.1 hypothetical protein NEQG_00564 [Nematocida parisii ERTm3]KAI5128545.1 hypothetical protein NEPAR08_1303 [Nematocida parisii]EIJ94003.1 hypothetical protein NEPG_00668 [Nematocida parisii ERTm1]KAI5128570.1 hypothetical protein NEPAR03_1377 [Nematocida parisii]KAI5141868.1 hypothetical protein NEPAR04_1251 [Nematocida parisii]|eukprot:XP_013058499.1 hypothetical protein NEPG_00668 [Nematocida parisii ERTm1]
MRKEVISIILGGAVCLFVLWPIFLSRRTYKTGSKEKKESHHPETERRIASRWGGKSKGKTPLIKIRNGRPFVGCIPIKDGKIFMINGRENKKFIFPKGGIDKNEEGYYTAGKEAIEEVGVIGNIDKTPFAIVNGIYWYVLEVTKVLPSWKERHERVRIIMDPHNALFHSEVRAVTKNVIKELLAQEDRLKMPRIKNTRLVHPDSPQTPEQTVQETTEEAF